MPVHDPRLESLQTPCLLLDEGRMIANIERLAARAKQLGVALRPHLKTSKSITAALRTLGDRSAPATVSTLAEAEFLAEAGFTNILYAVGISPKKLARVVVLRAKGCDVSVLLDSPEQADAVAQASRKAGRPIPALIEIDSDTHRGGLRPDDPLLLEVARRLHEGGAELRGVLTHAGESYGVSSKEAHEKFAELERDATVAAARTLREAGFPCPVVSVGSTPTAHAAKDLTGVTELRAGVYVFFDLVMVGIGVCLNDDIAVSVLTTVIGHQTARGQVLIDAGWMAMSRDRGTAAQALDQGYGLVCDEAGNLLPDLIVSAANQEHGVITRRPGSTLTMPDLPLGTRLRILPNHACATAAQHTFYTVIPTAPGADLDVWHRFRGW